jgi:hypothetical protein
MHSALDKQQERMHNEHLEAMSLKVSELEGIRLEQIAKKDKVKSKVFGV